MQALKDSETLNGLDSDLTQRTINSLNEIKKIKNLTDDECSESDLEQSECNDEESIVFSSESKNKILVVSFYDGS